VINTGWLSSSNRLEVIKDFRLQFIGGPTKLAASGGSTREMTSSIDLPFAIEGNFLELFDYLLRNVQNLIKYLDSAEKSALRHQKWRFQGF
jgi:hypothetical protein